ESPANSWRTSSRLRLALDARASTPTRFRNAVPWAHRGHTRPEQLAFPDVPHGGPRSSDSPVASEMRLYTTTGREDSNPRLQVLQASAMRPFAALQSQLARCGTRCGTVTHWRCRS